ncbi:MAG: arginine--tRNA ligase, partial [Candidatus Absconditabacterales bacterium]
MSIGHFRNTIIGQIIYNILQQTGCDHFNRNYIGDRGTAFGKFVTSLHYHYQQDPTIVDQIIANPESMMGVVYGKFKEIDVADKEEKARVIVQLLESGNTDMIELWTQIRTLSLVDFETVYKTLGVEFDCTLGESFAVQLDNKVLQDLQSKHIVHESQGALIIKLKRTEEGSRKPLQTHELDTREEGRDQVLVFAKSDGSTLYAPRDLSLLKYRSQVIQADNMIYVVGSEQSVYFQQIIALGIYLGYIKDNQMMHLGFGLYLQNGKKMASRTGGAYRVMELIEEITQAILQQFEERMDHDSAQKLAVSALIINDTKGDISKDVNLDIASMTKLNGDTGVYVQYTAVRLKSLIQKIVGTSSIIPTLKFPPEKITYLSPEEKSLLFQTSLLAYKTRQSLDLIKPHVLTQYLLDLAGRFNKRYNDSPKVLEMDEHKKQALYPVLESYRIVFEKVMTLLHLPVVEKM